MRRFRRGWSRRTQRTPERVTKHLGLSVELQDRLLAGERRLWNNDAVFYQGHLAKSALLVFAETGTITRDVAVREIRRENAEGRRWEHVEFNEVRCLAITAGVVLLTYQVSARWAHDASSRRAEERG